MIYRLIILNGDRRGEQITITREPMIIGRGPSCEIRINDPEIALTHAEISHTDDGLSIRDLGSMNRLLINHREVHEAHLKHGDVAEVGHTRFLIQAYVQAEFQNGVADEGDDEERANRRKAWFLAGGLVLSVLFLFLFIPRCERLILTPRPPPTTPTKPVPQPIRKAITPVITPAPVTNPPPAITPAIVPAPRPAEPVAVPPPLPRNEPPAVSPPVPAPPHPSATSDLLAASERELQEAALTLKGNKPASPNTSNAPLAAPPAEPVKAVEPIAPQVQPSVVPDRVVPQKPSPAPPSREVLVAPATNLIRIAGADINKFPETDQFREMRLLTIRLNALESRQALDPAAVRVEVVFVNKDKTTGQLSPASRQPSAASLGAQGVWQAPEQRSLVASYVVPATQPAAARTAQYHGFSIGVYYNGTLQDELRQPGDLPTEFGFPATSRAKQVP